VLYEFFITHFHHFVSTLQTYRKVSNNAEKQVSTGHDSSRTKFAFLVETFLSRNRKYSNEVAMSNFKVVNKSFNFSTKGEIDFVDLTDQVQEVVTESAIKNGMVHVFAPHATGILVLTENDYGLLNDIKTFLEEIVPKRRAYQHPSNAHSHLRSMLLPPDKTLPVISGHVEFGTWQSLLFVETDVYPRQRTLIMQVIGEE
jgi:secondary thiamine-phosphate synthase enzyme